MKTDIKTHVTMTKAEVEFILKTLIERRVGMSVTLMRTELEQTKAGVELKAYHFECDHDKTKYALSSNE